jgi:hypothetical protein
MAQHLSSIPRAMDVLAVLWASYFPREAFCPEDPRLGSVSVLLRVFEEDLATLRATAVDARRATLSLEVAYVVRRVPFEDFLGILRAQPAEVIGCMVGAPYLSIYLSIYLSMCLSVYLSCLMCRMPCVYGTGQGLAASLLMFSQGLIARPKPFQVVLFGLGPPTPFHEIKSHTVGQLVAVTGYVVRVSASRPLVVAGAFLCSKCGKHTRCSFSDGVFSPPSVCDTDK